MPPARCQGCAAPRPARRAPHAVTVDHPQLATCPVLRDAFEFAASGRPPNRRRRIGTRSPKYPWPTCHRQGRARLQRFGGEWRSFSAAESSPATQRCHKTRAAVDRQAADRDEDFKAAKEGFGAAVLSGVPCFGYCCGVRRCRASLLRWPIDIDHHAVHGFLVRQGSVYVRCQSLGVEVLCAEDHPPVANPPSSMEATKVLAVVGHHNPA